MKIFITGIAGCLGSNLADKFLNEGYEVSGIDNFATGSREYIKAQENINFFEGSISDYIILEEIIKDIKPNIIIHSAASYKDPKNFRDDIDTNILGTCNLVDLSIKYEISRFLFFQTALCYGRPQLNPIPISHALNPFTSYGITKAAGEKFILNSDLNFVSLRLANICGPRLSIGPIPTFYKRLKNNQSVFCTNAVRDFLDFDDFYSLIQTILSNDTIKGTFNVSTGIGNSVFETYKLVCEYLKIPVNEIDIIPVDKDDVETVILDPALTFELGWSPSNLHLKDIIFKQLEFYDKYGIENIFSHLKDSR